MPKFSLLTSRHHGFISETQSLTNLLVTEELVTKWLDEDSAVNLIYLGFSNAFDSADRWLLALLNGYGIAITVKMD